MTIYLYLGAFGTLKAVDLSGERKKSTKLFRLLSDVDAALMGEVDWAESSTMYASATLPTEKDQVTFPHFLKPLLALVLPKPLQLLMQFTDQQKAHPIQTQAYFPSAQ